MAGKRVTDNLIAFLLENRAAIDPYDFFEVVIKGEYGKKFHMEVTTKHQTKT